MSRRYIIALDSSTQEQNDAFTNFVRENGFGWWYWIKDFWLITDPTEKFNVEKIRDVVNKTHPGVHCFLIELKSDCDTWAGYGPNTEERNMFTWIETNWNKYK